MQIPVLSGIVSDGNAEFRQSYPVNLVPVPKETGISQGYLRPADGIVAHGLGPGINRGSINWRGTCYRVMGGSFVSVASNGMVATLGTVAGNSGHARFAFGFDRLAIVAGGKGYYYSGATFAEITDPDLGTVIDVTWTGGYFLFTDGVNIIQTELVDPTQIDALKYGSAELHPDGINSMLLRRDEPYAVGRYTIEVYRNVGGSGFAFTPIEGAQVQRGSLGVACACVFGEEAIAFLGSGEKESPSVYLSVNATTQRIATREIDTILQDYTESQLSESLVETRFDKGHQHLLIHLTDRTLVYDAAASVAAEEPVWFVLTSTLEGFSAYRARNLVWCYDKWLCGDPLQARVGFLSNELSSHYGFDVRWEFGTVVVYNDGVSGIVHEMELVALTGRTTFGLDPYISTSYSKDGLTWSQDKPIKVGARGQRDKRLMWRQLGTIGHFRVQRFRGDSQSYASFARLEAQIEPLACATV